MQCAWSVFLILTGHFEALTQLTSLAMLLTGSVTVALIFVLRFKKPNSERPYRCSGYPFMPLLYLLCNLGVLGFCLYEALRNSTQVLSQGEASLGSYWKEWYPLFGLFLFVLAFVTHAIWRRNFRRK